MNTKARVIIAGGSGFIGQALAQLLVRRGNGVVILSRTPRGSVNKMQFLAWDGKTIGDWASALEGATAVVNLTGKSINCRFTPSARQEILRSRVDSVRVLGDALARCTQSPQVFVQASGIGYYGHSGDRILDETAPAGSDFMAKVCRAWEEAFRVLDLPGTRKVILRIGVVLGRDGGALVPLEKLTRLFLGGAVGSGRQFISWIHLHDLLGMFVDAIELGKIDGVFNATAPAPVTNGDFMRELRRALHRPWSPPAPTPLVRLGARFMGIEPDLALGSLRCLPQRFLEHGFRFDFPELRNAFAHLYGMDKAVAA